MDNSLKAVIIDLDNTLYSWINAFSKYFESQVYFISNYFNIPENQLLGSFKRIFKKHGSVEIPDAVSQLDILNDQVIYRESIKYIQDKTHEIMVELLKKHLHVFPGVEQTLSWFAKKGMLVLGYSDAFAYWINLRLHILDLFDYFDVIFTSNNDIISESYYVQNAHINNKIQQLKPNQNKPSSYVYNLIAEKYRVTFQNMYMIGDNLQKDIFPAQCIGVTDIWAKYGTKHDKCSFLSKVTPWKKNDKQYSSNITPTYTINQFNDVVGIIDSLT